MFNKAFGRIFIPGLKLMLGLLVVFSAYGAIGFWSKLNAVSIAMVLVFCVSCSTWIFPGAVLMSFAYNISGQFKPNLYHKIHFSNDSKAGFKKLICLKQLRACQVIRCQVGHFYHMEQKAKLTLLNTLINGVVFLLVRDKVK